MATGMTVTDRRIVDAVDAVAQAMTALSMLWGDYRFDPDRLNSVEGYPFDDCFDELTVGMQLWASNVRRALSEGVA